MPKTDNIFCLAQTGFGPFTLSGEAIGARVLHRTLVPSKVHNMHLKAVANMFIFVCDYLECEFYTHSDFSFNYRTHHNQPWHTFGKINLHVHVYQQTANVSM